MISSPRPETTFLASAMSWETVEAFRPRVFMARIVSSSTFKIWEYARFPHSSSAAFKSPIQRKAPFKAPTEAPATAPIRIPASVTAFKAPIWYAPLAPPPSKTTPYSRDGSRVSLMPSHPYLLQSQ